MFPARPPTIAPSYDAPPRDPDPRPRLRRYQRPSAPPLAAGLRNRVRRRDHVRGPAHRDAQASSTSQRPRRQVPGRSSSQPARSVSRCSRAWSSPRPLAPTTAARTSRPSPSSCSSGSVSKWCRSSPATSSGCSIRSTRSPPRSSGPPSAPRPTRTGRRPRCCSPSCGSCSPIPSSIHHRRTSWPGSSRRTRWRWSPGRRCGDGSGCARAKVSARCSGCLPVAASELRRRAPSRC